MKRFLLTLLICAVLIPSAFAKAEDIEVTASSDKVFGITPGVRLSVIGLEPTIGVELFNLELEGCCALNTGLDGEQFGYAPSFTVAYNTNPFERGGFAVFGGEYMYLTPAYTNMIIKTIDEEVEGDVLPGIHTVSFIYKGGYRFNHVFGLLWRFRLPLLIAGENEEVKFNLNVTNLPGVAGCFLLGVCTTSIGVQFTF